jgi:hypothetical protein
LDVQLNLNFVMLIVNVTNQNVIVSQNVNHQTTVHVDKIVVKDFVDQNVIQEIVLQVNFVKTTFVLKVVNQNQIAQMIWIVKIINVKIHVKVLNVVIMQFVDQQIIAHFVFVLMVLLVNLLLNVRKLNVNEMKIVIWINDVSMEVAKILASNVEYVETMLNVELKIVKQFVHVSSVLLAIRKFNV